MAAWDDKGTDPNIDFVRAMDAQAREIERLKLENAQLKAKLQWISELSSGGTALVES